MQHSFDRASLIIVSLIHWCLSLLALTLPLSIWAASISPAFLWPEVLLPRGILVFNHLEVRPSLVHNGLYSICSLARVGYHRLLRHSVMHGTCSIHKRLRWWIEWLRWLHHVVRGEGIVLLCLRGHLRWRTSHNVGICVVLLLPLRLHLVLVVHVVRVLLLI